MNDVNVKRNYPSFTVVYNVFLDSEDLLTGYEKLVFILLLRYGNNAFPSMRTLAKKCGISLRTVNRVINSLEEKGVLSRVNRKNKFGGDTSNAYILKDYSEIWESGTQDEMKRAAKNDISDEEFEKMARERGYIKVKEPVHRTAKQEQALKSKNKLSKSDVPNSNSNISVSQLDNITKVNNSQGKNNNVNVAVQTSDEVLDGQISLDEVIDEQEQEKDYEAIYGNNELVTLAEGVEYSFTRAEMEEISAILTRIKTPKQEDMNPYDAVIYGKQRYLREKYAKLKTEIEKKERKGEHIGCVFSYFKKMLENDTYKPLAYKREDEQ